MVEEIELTKEMRKWKQQLLCCETRVDSVEVGLDPLVLLG